MLALIQLFILQRSLVDIDTRVNVENAYKTRWVWYHTILCLNLFLTNILLICLLTLISLKM